MDGTGARRCVMTPEARLTALLVTEEEAARERSEQVRARVRARLARYAGVHKGRVVKPARPDTQTPNRATRSAER